VLGALLPQRPLIFNFGELKLRNLAKLWFFKLIRTKLNLKKSIMTSFSDIIAITSPKKHHQNNVTQFFYFAPAPNQIFWLRQCNGIKINVIDGSIYDVTML